MLLSRTRSRPRRSLAAAGLATALALTLGACGGGGSAPPATGTFVGMVADPAVSVAVVARPAAAGQAEREVRALVYGDTKNNIQEFFEGAATGNDLDLASETGATLKGSVAADAASGTIVLADGKSIAFTAAPATGPAGWYGFTGLGDKVTGTSTEGGRIEAGFSPSLAGPGMYTLTGTVTPANGSPTSFTTPFLVPAGPQPLDQSVVAVIVSSDGKTIRGGAKSTKKGGGGGSGFHVLLID